MRRRKRGPIYRSSTRRAFGTWFGDQGTGVAAPSANTVDNDVLLAGTDYSLSQSDKEKVRVRRILFTVMWNQVEGSSASTGASCIFDAWLCAMSPDDAAAAVTAGVNYVDHYPLDSRIIRATTRHWMDASVHSTQPSSVFQQQRLPSITWSIKCNLKLSEPQALYFFQRRNDVDSSPNVTFEYTYRSRVYFTRG